MAHINVPNTKRMSIEAKQIVLEAKLKIGKSEIEDELEDKR